jgi:hypothetical protein
MTAIKVPSVMRKRGRPKGLEKTVIGQPCKRQRFHQLPHARRPFGEKKLCKGIIKHVAYIVRCILHSITRTTVAYTYVDGGIYMYTYKLV